MPLKARPGWISAGSFEKDPHPACDPGAAGATLRGDGAENGLGVRSRRGRSDVSRTHGGGGGGWVKDQFPINQGASSVVGGPTPSLRR